MEQLSTEQIKERVRKVHTTELTITIQFISKEMEGIAQVLQDPMKMKEPHVADQMDRKFRASRNMLMLVSNELDRRATNVLKFLTGQTRTL